MSKEREIEGVITKSRLRSIRCSENGSFICGAEIPEENVMMLRVEGQKWINNFPTRSTVKTIRSLLTRMNVGA
ncbi:unnamed protein product [Brassica rapa]|uniref:Uncharacterized protein n=2 Tax=Brassica TaxID=3705 RepID=A0A8D9LP78_BRACM|nr:unnamed protein product [Brassica napus]CAG7881607.1 unnamed protein product [Brassica rapa]